MEYDRKYKGEPLIHGYDSLVTSYTLNAFTNATALEVVVFAVEDQAITGPGVKVRMNPVEALALASHLVDAAEQVQQ